MKSNIIEQLSAIPAETVVRIQQVANVITCASSAIDEVTVQAQVIAHFWITLGLVLKASPYVILSYDLASFSK